MNIPLKSRDYHLSRKLHAIWFEHDLDCIAVVLHSDIASYFPKARGRIVEIALTNNTHTEYTYKNKYKSLEMLNKKETDKKKMKEKQINGP